MRQSVLMKQMKRGDDGDDDGSVLGREKLKDRRQ